MIQPLESGTTERRVVLILLREKLRPKRSQSFLIDCERVLATCIGLHLYGLPRAGFSGTGSPAQHGEAVGWVGPGEGPAGRETGGRAARRRSGL